MGKRENQYFQAISIEEWALGKVNLQNRCKQLNNTSSNKRYSTSFISWLKDLNFPLTTKCSANRCIIYTRIIAVPKLKIRHAKVNHQRQLMSMRFAVTPRDNVQELIFRVSFGFDKFTFKDNNTPLDLLKTLILEAAYLKGGRQNF